MSRRIVLRCADANHPEGGHARLRVSGMETVPTPLRLQIRRYDVQERYLGTAGWQVAEVWQTAGPVERSGDDVLIVLGPEVVDHLHFGQAVEFEIDGAVGVLHWPEVAPTIITARSRNRVDERRRGAVDPIAMGPVGGTRSSPPPPPPPLPPPPPPAPPPPMAATSDDPRVVAPWPDDGGKARHHRTPLTARLVAGIAVVVLGAGGVALTCPFGQPFCLQSASPPLPPPASIASAPTPLPCRPDAILATAETPERLYREAIRCGSDGGDWNASVVALEASMASGYAPAATRLGQLYDPVGFVPGRVFSRPDPLQAAKYYRMAADGGDQAVVAPREALRQWLLERSGRGDPIASIALKDHW